MSHAFVRDLYRLGLNLVEAVNSRYRCATRVEELCAETAKISAGQRNMSESGLCLAVSSQSAAIEDLSTSLNMKTPAVRLDNDDLSQYEDASY